MNNNHCCSCCTPGPGGGQCCPPPPQQARRRVNIDFLYLDLDVCTRCAGTDASLDAALADVDAVLKAAGFDVVVNKVNISSKELAIKYQFVSSPTIRVNGRDIQPEVKESLCESCGDLCGGSVDCRVWTYEGQDYTVPPREMIVNAILKEVYAGGSAPAAPPPERDTGREYRLPPNLEAFFDLRNRRQQE